MAATSIPSYRNFLYGTFAQGEVATHAWLEVHNPATDALEARVELADATQAVMAVRAAAQAQRRWRAFAAIERGEVLRAMAQALLTQLEPIAAMLARETGKSPDDARAEVRYGAQVVQYHAEWARRVEGEIIPSDNPNEQLLLMREPIGVVACLIPFNFPIYTLLRKIAPALITGNAVVVRPSNHTPASALELAKALAQVDMPVGLINILAMQHDVAQVLCTQPQVGMFTLTGSVAAGRQMLELAKENIAKTSLELGGKTPAIVAADADIESVAEAIVRSRLSNCGQLCTSVERVLVVHEAHDALVAALQARMEAVRCGNRAKDADNLGPLISRAARERVHAMVQGAMAEGAKLHCGGAIPKGHGHFYPPTLLSRCHHNMEIMREEVFGPVLAVTCCRDVEHALEYANDHQFGLTSVYFGERHSDIMRVATSIEAGELYVNRLPADPYQGYHAGWKRSGLGGDDGKHGMLEFTQTRLVVLPTPALPT